MDKEKRLSDNDKILLAHGGGGKETSELIGGIIFEELYGREPGKLNAANDARYRIKLLEDAAILDSPQKIAFTTDSFTVSPLFFKGGDIGKLAVAGTVNDLSVMGARPLFLSLGLIIEEGFSSGDLRKIIKSISKESRKTGVRVVTGDTKVVPVGKADGIFINTSGIGDVLYDGISVYNIAPGDAVIVSGNVGDHGAAVMSQREGIKMDVEIESDCASLWDMIESVLKGGVAVSAVRDATRGGLAAVLNEWAAAAEADIYAEEEKIPVNSAVKGFCELLGFEPYQLACEGRAVFAVKPEFAEKALDILKSHPLGKDASVIGVVEKNNINSLDYRFALAPNGAREVYPKLSRFRGNDRNDGNDGNSRDSKGKVILKGIYGVNRLLDYPSGELLPRIC